MGTCDPRFATVREAFAENFASRDEVGAGLCVRVGGEVVVDLWGGFCDEARTRPWQRDTIVNAYSVGKGVLAALVLHLVERGWLDYDARVAALWPEFAAEGKQDHRLSDLLSHRGGLPGLRKRVSEGTQYDWSTMCNLLAAQEPYWPLGEGHGYHVNTYGFLVGEVVRRATGLGVGEALRRFLCDPLDADYWWGVPRAEHARAAEIQGHAPHVRLEGPEQWKLAMPPTGDDARDEMVWHTYFNPPGLSGMGTIHTREWREAAIPSTNGHGTARAVAAIYDTLLAKERSTEVLARALAPASDGDDKILGRPSRFGMGFQLPRPDRPLGANPGNFGHYGFGGSLGFGDPEAGVAFGYVMNLPGDRWQTPRANAVVGAVYEALDV